MSNMYTYGLSLFRQKDFATSFTLFPRFAFASFPKKRNDLPPHSTKRPLSINAWPSNRSFHPSSPPTPYSHSTTRPFPSSASYPSPSTHRPSSRTQPCYR